MLQHINCLQKENYTIIHTAQMFDAIVTFVYDYALVLSMYMYVILNDLGSNCHVVSDLRLVV